MSATRFFGTLILMLAIRSTYTYHIFTSSRFFGASRLLSTKMAALSSGSIVNFDISPTSEINIASEINIELPFNVGKGLSAVVPPQGGAGGFFPSLWTIMPGVGQSVTQKVR
jgi:hypothetical protein